MRKDSWFRGALLSVLFFSLMIAGAPTAAEAMGTSGGSSEGNTGLLDMPCPPNGSGPWQGSSVLHAGCAWNEMNDVQQCAAAIGAVAAASFIVAGLAAQIETAGGATAVAAVLLLRYGRAMASYMRAVAAAITAGCAMFLTDL